MERLKRIIIVTVGLGFGIKNITGQNLIPNPGFETVSLCPTAAGQFNGYVGAWVAANTASPDYAACSFTGTSFTRITAATGSAAAGIWGATGHPNCVGSAYTENVTAALTAPLVPGNSYQVSFAVMVDGLGSATAAPNACVNVGLYFYEALSPPVMNGMCCMAVTPQLSVQGDQVAEGSYLTFTGSFTATAACDRVQLGAFCNGNSSTAFCNDFANRRLYFNFDNITLLPVSPLPAQSLMLHALPHSGGNLLKWQASEAAVVQVWKSTNGNAFSLIRSLTNENTWLDENEFQSRVWYRLSVQQVNGDWMQSEVVEVLREDESLLIVAWPEGWRVDGIKGEWEGSLWDATGRRMGEVKGIGSMEVPAPGRGIYWLRIGPAVSRGTFIQ